MGEGLTMKGHEGTLVAMTVISVTTHSTRCPKGGRCRTQTVTAPAGLRKRSRGAQVAHAARPPQTGLGSSSLGLQTPPLRGPQTCGIKNSNWHPRPAAGMSSRETARSHRRR